MARIPVLEQSLMSMDVRQANTIESQDLNSALSNLGTVGQNISLDILKKQKVAQAVNYGREEYLRTSQEWTDVNNIFIKNRKLDGSMSESVYGAKEDGSSYSYGEVVKDWWNKRFETGMANAPTDLAKEKYAVNTDQARFSNVLKAQADSLEMNVKYSSDGMLNGFKNGIRTITLDKGIEYNFNEFFNLYDVVTNNNNDNVGYLWGTELAKEHKNIYDRYSAVALLDNLVKNDLGRNTQMTNTALDLAEDIIKGTGYGSTHADAFKIEPSNEILSSSIRAILAEAPEGLYTEEDISTIIEDMKKVDRKTAITFNDEIGIISRNEIGRAHV